MYCIIMAMGLHSADRILSRMQGCEIRTLYRPIDLYDKVYIYTPNPYGMIIGEFTIRDVHLIKNIYDLNYVEEKCTSLLNKIYLERLDDNFNTNKKLIVIEIGERKKYRVPVKLKYIRELIYDFRPPVNYRILDLNTCKTLERIVNALNESSEMYHTLSCSI